MSKTYYINGNTVRELEEAQPIRPERRSREEIERTRREKNRRNAARRNRERAFGMSRGYVFFLSICVAASAFSAVSLIQTQSSVTQKMKNVAALQSQIDDLQSDNFIFPARFVSGRTYRQTYVYREDKWGGIYQKGIITTIL